jgi:hypothetical protein
LQKNASVLKEGQKTGMQRPILVHIIRSKQALKACKIVLINHLDKTYITST